jgi:hypothetical protein
MSLRARGGGRQRRPARVPAEQGSAGQNALARQLRVERTQVVRVHQQPRLLARHHLFDAAHIVALPVLRETGVRTGNAAAAATLAHVIV